MAKKIERIFLVIFGILLIGITCVCLGKPQHNLIPSRMVIYTIIWLLLLGAGRCMLLLFGGWLERKNKRKLSHILCVVCLAVWAVLLYLTGCVSRSEPHTDYGSVYQAAEALAKGLSVENWNYFSTWTNNRFPMLFLSVLLRAGYGLGMTDAYYFVLGFQVIHIVLAAGCVYYLAGKGTDKNSIANRWTALMLMALMTPIWGNIGFFYTDQLSFGYSIIAYTLLYLAIEKKLQTWQQILLAAMAGLLWGLACQIKVTTAIALLALGIILILRRHFKGGWKQLVAFGVMFLLMLTVTNRYMKSLPCEEYVERDARPTLYWVALGLNGDGSHGSNLEFADLCGQAADLQEREQLVKEKIRSDWKNFFDGEHIVAKTRKIFACGDLGASGYLTFPYQEGNFIYETISWDGQYFWKYACLSTGYIFAIYLLIALGAFRAAFNGKAEPETMCAFVTIFGIMLFLMLWEAQNKQLFNQTCWLVLAAGYGLQVIDEVKLWKK